MRYRVHSLSAVLLCSMYVWSQPPIAWQKSYGGSFPDRCHSIVATEDGGFVVLAYTASSDGDVLGFHGQSDLWVLKLDGGGTLEWQRCFGGSGAETAGQVAQTPDGGFIVVGSSASSDGDVSENFGASDIWLVRLSVDGDLLWERSFGGSDVDVGEQVAVRPDGSYLVMGFTFSQDGHASDNHGLSDFWLSHVAEGGELLQSRCYGGSGFDHLRVMHHSADGVVVFGGVTNSNDGDVIDNTVEGNQAWVVYLANGWDITWQNTLGGGGDDQAYALFRLEGDTILVAVLSNSQNGDITDPWGSNDFWVVSLGSDGTLLQQRSFGGSSPDNPRYMISPDGGQSIYIAGSTASTDGLVIGQHGGPTDAWLIYLDAELNLLWQRALGGTGADGANSLCLASDGSLVVGGLTSSSDGDATGANGSTDVWVVKLEPDDVGLREESALSDLRLYPNPAANQLTIAWKEEAKSFTVHDARGELVASLDRLPAGQRQHQLNVEGWADGLYTVQLNGAGGRHVHRFAKQ